MTAAEETVGEPCPSEFALERLRAGELSPTAAQRTHLEGCPSCGERLARMAVPPPPLDLEAIRREAGVARRAPGGWRSRWFLVPVAAAAVAGALLLAPRPDLQTKGTGFTLSIIARTPDGSVRRLAPGTRLRGGDQLRFELTTAWPTAEVALVSMDARGAVSPLVPATGNTATVPGGRKVLLDGAVELDDTPGPERILLVACQRPLSVTAVVEAARTALARAGGDPRRVGPLGTGCHEESVWIERGQP